jgi:hypothetical protein
MAIDQLGNKESVAELPRKSVRNSAVNSIFAICYRLNRVEDRIYHEAH